MLGRHVYRVEPRADRWTIKKEGGGQPLGGFASREDAMAEARRLADANQPSKITLGDGDGIILEEHLFGDDLSDELS